jgi:broad specificity phosphatase PhoE
LSGARGFREVCWVRHGESVGNIGARTEDSSGYTLTAYGEKQAALFAERLPNPPDLIVVSRYRRAQQTAAPCIARFAAVPVEEWPVEEMHYLSRERTRQTTQIERRALGRGFWDLSDPDFVEGEGAESFREFIARADDALLRSRQRAESFIVIFAHSLFLRAVLWRALFGPQPIDGEAMKLYREFSRGFDIPNCGHFRQLLTPDGDVFTGAIQPLDATEPRPTAEQIQLSGL